MTFREALRRFADPWVTAVLLGSAALYMLVLLIVSGGSSVQLTTSVELLSGGADTVALLTTTLLGRVFLLLLVLHFSARIAVGVERDREGPALADADPERIVASAWRYAVVQRCPAWQETADDVLGGAQVSESDARAVYRKRPTTLFKRLFQAALVLALFGLLLSGVTRQSGMVRIGEGETVSAASRVTTSRYDWRFPTGNRPLLFDRMSVEPNGIDPGFTPTLQPASGAVIRWPVTAAIVAENGGASTSFRARAYPPSFVDGKLVQVIGFGLAPHIVVETTSSKVADTYVPTLIAPDITNSDVSEVPGFPYRLALTMQPVSDALYLRSATYRAVVLRGSSVVASGTLGAGSSVTAGAYRISVPDTRFWVWVNVTSDPGVFVVVAAVLIALLALAGWFVVALIGAQRFALAEETDPKGTRLVVGVDASLTARGRARRTFERLLRALESDSGRHQG